MSEYKIGEFRANMKKAFDEASRGDSVCIDRYGEDFYLVAKKDWQPRDGFYTLQARPQVINLIDTVNTMESVRDLTKKNTDVSQSEQKD
jgi:hypothetical protein